MRKVLVLLLCFLLSACSLLDDNEKVKNEKYLSLVELLNDQNEFLDYSKFFTITTDINKLSDGSYRYFITIDEPKIAMYDIEAIAIEKNVDYQNNMAANIGIYEDMVYSFIPNQADKDKGFVKGLTISAISNEAEPIVYLLISYKNKDGSMINREFYRLCIEGNNNG